MCPGILHLMPGSNSKRSNIAMVGKPQLWFQMCTGMVPQILTMIFIYIYNNNKLVVRSLLFAPFIKQLPLVLVLSLLILGSMCRAIGVGIGLSCNFLATHADY